MCKRKCSDCGHYMSWVNLGMWGCNVNGNLDDPDNCDMYDSNPISEPIDTYCTTEDIKSLDEENNAPTIVSGEEFHELMKYINSMLNPCPICGEQAVIIAVFENDESTEVKYLQLLHESDDCENAHWFDETNNRFSWNEVFDVIEKWNDQSYVK